MVEIAQSMGFRVRVAGAIAALGMVAVAMPAAAADEEWSGFTDVSDDRSSQHFSEFHDEITWLAERGITTGYDNGDGTTSFKPHAQVTREAMAAFLYRAADSPPVELPESSPFDDVTPTNTEFYEEIVWLSEQEITEGWTVGDRVEFRPRANITRDAAAAFMHRFAGSPDHFTVLVPQFRDVPPGHPFYTEIDWTRENDIATGWSTPDGQYFRPHSPITRDAMAAFLYRYDQQFG